INVHVPVPADEEAANGSAKNRPWTGEIKRKILASARRKRIRVVREEEEPRNANVAEKQSAPERKVAERQATTTQGLRPALKRGSSFRRDDGAPEAIAVAVRERKALRVRFDLPEEETIAAPVVEPPRFPTGALGEPPESFAHSGPEMTAAFLMSVTAADAGSATAIDPELVARWTERKEASSRRLRYLRDYCPFQREEGYEEDEESTPETTTLPAEPDHAEEAPTRVKTGLPFDSPESEAEFAKAIRSRFLRGLDGSSS
uniref:Uncharacterized protein n=1 Tax=Setaria italica TaxID=4555 RepID=K4AL92_SETIT